MPVVVDTGPLLAYLRPNDPHHGRGLSLMEDVWDGRHGTPVSIDHVLVEGLNFLRSRSGRRSVSGSFRDLFLGAPDRRPPLVLRATPEGLLRRAADLHHELYDQGLSATDAVVLAHVRDLDATLATFDEAFRGLAPVADGSEAS